MESGKTKKSDGDIGLALGNYVMALSDATGFRKKARKKVVVIGAAGHGSVVADAAEKAGTLEIVGFLDSEKAKGETVLGVPVLGTIGQIEAIAASTRFSACTVAVGDNATRHSVVERIRDTCPVLEFEPVIHPSAIIGANVEIGAGSVVLAGAIVGPRCRIGNHCILNTGCQLDHDSVMADFSSLAPGVVTGGNVRIGEFSAVGLGASIIHGRSIGAETVIGAGAVVVDDVARNCVAYGVPARVVRRREHGERYL